MSVFLLQLLYKLRSLVRRHGGVYLLIYGYYRRKAACAKAGYSFNSKEQIVRGHLLLGKSKLIPQPFKYWGRAAYMACGAIAAFYDILALGLKGKVFIECGYRVNAGAGNIEPL